MFTTLLMGANYSFEILFCVGVLEVLRLPFPALIIVKNENNLLLDFSY